MEDNPFVALQETVSKSIVGISDNRNVHTQEALSEALFLGIYGSPVPRPRSESSRIRKCRPNRRCRRSTAEELDVRIAELESQIGCGGLRNASFVVCSMSAGRAEWSTSAAWRQ